MAKILIVDDEPRIRDLIREHLQYAGFVCEEAGDGGAALAVLAQGGIDLVILDIMMPFMDGMTCLREMRTRKIMTPVIMLTARSEEYDKLAGLGAAPTTTSSSPSPRGSWWPALGRAGPYHAQTGRELRRVHLGDLVIDTASHSVKVAGQEAPLTPQRVRPAGLFGQQQGHRPEPRENFAAGVELRLLRRDRTVTPIKNARPSGPLPQIHRYRVGHRV